MGALRNMGAAGIIAAIIIAQVILPATVDLVLSLALVAGGVWLGRKMTAPDA